MKKCKQWKWGLFILAVFMITMIGMQTVKAAEEGTTEEGFRWRYEDGIMAITYYSIAYGDPAKVVIPSEINGKPVKIISDWALDHHINMTTVIIPDSVTEIRENAFFNCENLTNITIPDAVTEIGKSVFMGCASLTSITIPNSVTEISEDVFYGCTSLKSITIPDSVTSIEKEAFGACSSLTSISIPGSVTSIGEEAFSFCSSLESITIPDSVTEIGDCAFEACESLESVKIGNSVTSIKNYAFVDCPKLTSITIPGSVTEFGEGALGYVHAIPDSCLVTPLSGFIIYGYSGTAAEEYAKDNGFTFKDLTPKCKSHTYEEWVVTKKATYTAKGKKKRTCSVCGHVEEADIAKLKVKEGTVLKNKTAFYKVLKGLKTVAYAAPLKKSVTTVKVPETVKLVGKSYKVVKVLARAFSGCTKLKTVTIGKNVTYIGTKAFVGCTKLKTATIGAGVKSIGKQAFYNCSALKKITIKSKKLTSKNVGSRAFNGISSKAVITVPKKKLKTYQTIFKSKGIGKKVTVVGK